MAATYTIDGQNLKTLGFDVKVITGIYDTPARKPETEINPALSSGVIGLHGANDIFVKERQIVIDTLLLASSVDDALTKLATLQALLYTAGTRELSVSYSNILYVCYCADGCDIERLNSVFDNPVAYSVKIKLVEINPMLKKARIVFNDWFLPSRDELNAIQSTGVWDDAGMTGNHYWSSTEIDSTLAFHENNGPSVGKNTVNHVRAIRFFTSITNYSLGDIGPAGGRIFAWDHSTGYFEVAPTDQSASQVWSNIDSIEIGVSAQGTAIGTGQANTNAIIGQSGHTDSAAKFCNDLVV